MRKALFTLLTGLIGAIAVHIFIVFQIPAFAGGQIGSLISGLVDFDETITLDEQAQMSAKIVGGDPFFRIVTCKMDLSRGPLSIKAAQSPQFWTLSLYDDEDTSIFSLVQRLSVNNTLDMIVIPSRDRGRLEAQNTLETLGDAIVTFSPRDEGYFILRIFQPDISWQQVVTDFADSVRCETLEDGL